MDRLYPERFPTEATLPARLLQQARYTDAWRIPLQQPALSPPALFLAVFGHRPGWLKGLFQLRNLLVRPFGLAASSRQQLDAQPDPAHCKVGDTLLGWTLYHLSEHELVIGRDNPHLDFRVIIRKQARPTGTDALFATLCAPHNTAGRAYLRAILPFHRPGFRWLLARAVAADRL
ncbi:DUF2867 domain-containing protein [Leeia sp.]|uniref:DUF2867 domain-containing protein n=1 Tax=Leeia sp. TaxID=2884678 RepID=UPI0035B3D0B8